MAAERGPTVAPSVATLRKIMKPVISTDIMGNRNVEVKAVGARAEPALIYNHSRVPDAVKAAEREEERIRMMQEEKAARLRQFQEDVKKRVRQINKSKRKQQMEKDYQYMEKQHNRVRSSLQASECLTDRKDRVLLHGGSSVSIQPTPSIGTSGKRTVEFPLESETERKAFERQNRQIHTFTSEARQKLSGRRVENDVYGLEDEMPGGHWVNDKPDSRLAGAWAEPDEEPLDDEYQVRNDGNRESFDSLENTGQRSSQRQFSSQPPHIHQAADEDAGDAEKENGDERAAGDRDNENVDDGEEEEEYQARLQRVKFNLRTAESLHSQHGTKKIPRKKASRFGRRPASAPDLRTGATELAERRLQEQLKLNYRRLYSDLERQAVRDKQRRKKQHLQIQKIKREKEEQRRQEEEEARRMVEPRDPVTGETNIEADLRQQMERSHLQEVLQEREEQRQKQREMIRYLDALRSNLREKMSKQGLELPSLCCCGETLWDTHPDTCANNCFYYKNHRAYARALQSLLTSSVAV